MESKAALGRLTRERILDVARLHFGRFGYRKASLVDIARDLGVVKGALYYHVPGGKLAMFNAVMDREEERLIARMREATARTDDPRDALRGAVRARLDYLRELKDLLGVRREIGEEISALTLAQERRFRRRERDLVEEILIRGEERGVFERVEPRRAAAAAIQAMIHALTIPELFSEDEGRNTRASGGDDTDVPPRLSDAFFALIFRGLERRA